MRPAGHRQSLPKGRRAHHKVKTGCKACKTRHQKCDERLPICSGCERHSTRCIYPETKDSQSPKSVHPSAQSLSDTRISLQRGISPSGCSDLNLDDLQLLHQYLTSTCVPTGQTNEVTVQERSSAPQLGQKYPFVMRGILAMAATHLSRLQPASQDRFTMMAARHHGASISDFRAALPRLNQENHQALISYSKSLLWCSFATDESIERKGTTGASSWLPTWFWLLHGSCQIVESARPWIEGGPHALYKPERRVWDILPSPDDRHIEEAMHQLLARIGLDAICEAVFSNLREAFARSSMKHENTPYRNAMNTWVGSLSYDYIQLLHKEEPWALIALAIFCVLVDRSERVWFMKGHGKLLLMSIKERLDVDWSEYLDWPLRELGCINT